MFRAPSYGNLPHLSSIVDNIGYGPDHLARFLDLSPRTLRGYIQAGQAPRPVMYALFWETAWGISHAEAAAINQHRALFSENQILKRRIAAQDKKIALLEDELSHGHFSANSPFFSAS